MPIVLSYSTNIWAAILRKLWGCSFWDYQETQFHSKIPNPWAFTTPPPLSQHKIPWALGEGVFCRCIHRIRTPQLCILIDCGFLHFDWLWFSVVISVCCKEKFPWWGVRRLLTCGCKNKCLYIVFVNHAGFKTSAFRFSFKNPDFISISSYLGF